MISVEKMKLPYWLLVGAALGLLGGYVWSIAPPGRDPLMRMPMTEKRLVDRVERSEVTHQPAMRELSVYPPTGDRQMILGETSGVGEWVPFVAYVKLPFHPNATGGDVDVSQYLGLSSSAPVRYLWWRAAWFGPSLGILLGLSLIGGLFPVVLRAVVRAGQAPNEKPTPPPAPAPTVVLPEGPAAEETSPQTAHAREIDEEIEVAAKTAAPEHQGPKSLEATPLTALSPEEESQKEYGGEYYPVARPNHLPDKKGFSLVELLVVIAIIAVLMGIILPSLHRATESARGIKCASNVRQLGVAMTMYHNENEGLYFWRGPHIDIDGMDWYAYGGRETGNRNLGQQNLFNRIVPRPLNKYMSDVQAVFRCPNDNEAPWTLDQTYTPYPSPNEFEWVGNSYAFNCNGYPLRPVPQDVGGLDAVKVTAVSSPSQTIVFYDACLYWGFDWHYDHKANIGFADGHVEFLPLPDQEGDLKWKP